MTARDGLSRFRGSPLLQVLGVRAITFPITLISGLLWIRLVIVHDRTSVVPW